MPKEPVAPTWQHLLLPVLRAYRGLGGRAANADVLAQVAEDEPALAAALAPLPVADNGVGQFYVRIAYARTRLREIGLIENVGVGFWKLTDPGASLPDGDVLELSRAADNEASARKKSK